VFPGVTRRGTLALEEGARREGISWPEANKPTVLNDWFRMKEWRIPRDSLLDQKKIEELQEARLLGILDRVQNFEKGPVLRFLLWFPMVQQFCKACLVSGSPSTTAMGAVFMASFVMVELLLFFARKPLERGEGFKAMLIMREWTNLTNPELFDDPVVPGLDSTKQIEIPKNATVATLCSGIGNYVLHFGISGKPF